MNTTDTIRTAIADTLAAPRDRSWLQSQARYTDLVSRLERELSMALEIERALGETLEAAENEHSTATDRSRGFLVVSASA